MPIPNKIAEFQSLIVGFDNKALGLSAIAGVLLAILLPEGDAEFSCVGITAIVFLFLAFLMSILVLWPRWHRERGGHSWYAIAQLHTGAEVAAKISEDNGFDLAKILRIKAILLRLSIITLTIGILCLLIELLVRFTTIA